jgi:hypothetical protein
MRKRDRFERRIKEVTKCSNPDNPSGLNQVSCEKVSWDGEPELLCLYNWALQSDTNTNITFGTAHTKLLMMRKMINGTASSKLIPISSQRTSKMAATCFTSHLAE